MKRSILMTATVLLAIIAAFYRLAPPSIHYHPGTALPVAHAQSTDPCNTGVKIKATLDSTAARTLVSGVGGQKIYVCEVVFTMASGGSGPGLAFILNLGRKADDIIAPKAQSSARSSTSWGVTRLPCLQGGK